MGKVAAEVEVARAVRGVLGMVHLEHEIAGFVHAGPGVVVLQLQVVCAVYRVLLKFTVGPEVAHAVRVAAEL